MASFTEALEENPAPRRLGDVWLRYEPGRLLGESQSPSVWHRRRPALAMTLATVLAVVSMGGLLAGGRDAAATLIPLLLGLASAALVGVALRLEGRLGRRRFVLHFRSERLRMERLRWAPGATRREWIPFDDVSAVEVVERATGHFALVVVWREGETRTRREVMVDHIGPGEKEALFRVWRLLHNAFGLRGAGLAGA
ncbi:hypothetical protein [Melittangium boletus]|uniref:Uncharacterized protein n=1 Tax=Melittangium boletus DSM 14713 TaxID=1294270 RepID=A0A286NVE7_9BACT|nr:hypothetical protein [Melittangium boletus]ATB27114.1 hypothetical protein MEBOL_000552 [Melittangium boletus DSM 14713]